MFPIDKNSILLYTIVYSTMKDYIKLKDIVALYHVHPETVRRWVHTGKMQAVKIGKFYFFPKQDQEPTSVGVITNPTYKRKNPMELTKEIINASKKGIYESK